MKCIFFLLMAYYCMHTCQKGSAKLYLRFMSGATNLLCKAQCCLQVVMKVPMCKNVCNIYLSSNFSPCSIQVVIKFICKNVLQVSYSKHLLICIFAENHFIVIQSSTFFTIAD